MPGPYVNQAPVDDTTDMGNDNQRPRSDPQVMGILQRIMQLLESQAAPPPGMPPGMPGPLDGLPGMGGGGMPPQGPPGMGGGMGGGLPPGLAGTGPPPMPGPGMPPPMPSPGMPPGMPPMGGPPGGGMPPMPMPPMGNPAGTGGMERDSPFARYAAQRLQGMGRPTAM